MGRKASKIRVLVLTVMAVSALLATGISRARADDKAETQGIVDKARITFEAFMGDKNYSWLHENLKNAKGILIYPQILKAGFILGGSGGTGVYVAHHSLNASRFGPAGGRRFLGRHAAGKHCE